MYLPKSKYSVKETSAGTFIYEFSKREVKGGSYIAMSDGTFFAGNNIQEISPSDKLIPSAKEKKDNTYILTTDYEATSYNFLTNKGKKISKQQDKLEPLYPTKPAPTSEDYIKGYFYRYFAKRKNSSTEYYEIDEETYKDLKDKGGKYDYNLYVTQKMKWDLTDSAKKTNNTSIRLMKKMKELNVFN